MALMPDNPLAVVPYGRPEVTLFHDAQVLGPGVRKVVVFGITGHGKSSFLNFVLRAREDVFRSTSGGLLQTDSVTKETQACPAMIGGEQWMLIDTPGFFDTDQLQEGIGKSLAAQFQQQKSQFCSHIFRALLEAGKEVSAFFLVYNGATRWSLEMSQQIKFLNSIQFPWSHCILAITHADTAFKGVDDDKRRYKEFIKAMGDPKSKSPEQLKELMRSTSYRVILVESVESLKKGDGYHESVVTRMKDYMSEIEEKHGKYHSKLFAYFDGKYSTDCHIAYMSSLQESPDKLQQLVSDTKEDATAFVRAGQKAAKDQEELIRTVEDIAQLADNQTLITLEKANKIGKVIAAAGAAVVIVSTLALSCTAGLSAIPLGIGAAVSVHGFKKWTDCLKEIDEVKQAQSCLEQGRQSLQELYSHYQSLLTKIDKAGLNQHPSTNDSLVAHLLAVHAHDAQERSPALLQAAQELSVFHTLRKAATGELTPEQAEIVCGNCALPIGFNILTATMDVARVVGTTLQIVKSTTKSTTMDSTLLRSSCIQTLVKECKAIKTLCNRP